MHVHDHSTVREGAATGAIGATIVAAWYLIVDLAAGRVFQTPNALGTMLLRGDFAPVRTIVPEAVAGYAIVHFLLFVLVGMGLTRVVHLATRDIALRMAVWLGLVLAFSLFAGLAAMAGTAAGGRLPSWSVVSGSLLGVLGMAGYLWRRHPRLSRSFQEAPLGAEVRPPPHPPGG